MTSATAPKKQRKVKKIVGPESSEGDETEDSHSGMVLNDSTEYSEEDVGEDDFSGSYPFAEQQPQVRDLLKFLHQSNYFILFCSRLGPNFFLFSTLS